MPEDYYKTLDLGRDASEAELKKAYRRKAMKYHPDRNPDDTSAEAQFKEVKEAYEVLSDPQKRQAYDQFGHAGVNPGGGGGGAGSGDFGDVFGDIFGDIFGGARGGAGRGRRSRVFRGADLRYELDLELEEAVFGTKVEIDIPSLTTCETCDGNGAEPGSKPVTCDTCGGSGQVRMQQGFFSLQQTCPRCRGQGEMIGSPCGKCRGQGRVEQTRTLAVTVPAGVDTGDRIRLPGEGEAGRNGGPSGDLYVEVRLKGHPIFERDGADLSCEIPVSFVTCALGGSVEVPTLNGAVSLKIPVGTQSGRTFRLRGKGVKPVRGGAVGDLYCQVTVETPVNLTSTQKDLLRKFEDTLDTDKTGRHSPRERTWIDRVKEFFDELGD